MMRVTMVMGGILAIGVLMSRYVSFQTDVRKAFVFLIVNVAMPCIILNAIFHQSLSERLLGQMGITFALSLAGNAVGMLIGWLVCLRLHIPPKGKRELAVLAGLGNTASMGLPLCSVLFGPEGTLLGAVFDAGVDLMIWTVVMLMLQESPRLSLKSLKQFINVPVFTIMVGIVLALFDLRPPEMLKQLTSTLSQLTLPLTMIYIGLLLANVWKERGIRQYIRRLSIPFVVKLIVFPSVVLLAVHFFAIPKSVGQVVAVQASMPVLAIAPVIFSYCKADEKMAAVATAGSTLISFITVPVMMFLGQLQ